MKVSVIIVNYNVKKILAECIESCKLALQKIHSEIIIVDNCSTDGSQEYIQKLYPEVIWIQNQKNAGFSKANNKGIKQAKGEFILILNPDTLVSENLFKNIIPFAENSEKFGILGVRLVDATGVFHPESKRNIPNLKNTFDKLFSNLNIFRKNKKSINYYNTSLKEYDCGKVEILTGAFMFTRKSDFLKLGGFDEKYFMYGEDIDLSYTYLRHGFSNYYFGKETVVHYKGESTIKNKEYYKRFFGAMKIFVKKYYAQNIFKYYFLIFGLQLRYFLAIIISKLEK